jgi:hypothetical protein
MLAKQAFYHLRLLYHSQILLLELCIYYSPFDADEHGVNKLSGEKCCLLKLAAAGAPPRGAPGPYI